MPQVARMSDIGIGICCCHSKPRCRSMIGFLITGSSVVYTDDLPSSRIGDIVMASCGHLGLMITGSSIVVDDDIPECRLGDMFTGCFTGNIITGSSIVEDIN